MEQSATYYVPWWIILQSILKSLKLMMFWYLQQIHIQFNTGKIIQTIRQVHQHDEIIMIMNRWWKLLPFQLQVPRRRREEVEWILSFTEKLECRKFHRSFETNGHKHRRYLEGDLALAFLERSGASPSSSLRDLRSVENRSLRCLLCGGSSGGVLMNSINVPAQRVYTIPHYVGKWCVNNIQWNHSNSTFTWN